MKRIVSVILMIVLCIGGIASADVDLSGMTFEELLELQQKVNDALFSSDEWIEVEVPLGVWDIGKDIPAGRYELSASPKAGSYRMPYVSYYLERHENGSPNKLRGSYRIEEGNTLVIDLYEGNVIKIEDRSVIFRKYVPSFSFK